MKNLKQAALAAACLALAAAATGCGSDAEGTGSDDTAADASSQVELDLGNDKTVEVSGQPKIGVFTAGSKALSFSKALEDGVEEGAKDNNVEYTMFEANFDPAAQYNQIQNAIDAGTFDRILVQPIGSQVCDLVKQAGEQGIVVVVMVSSLCGEDTESGDGAWTPGTLGYIASGGGYDGLESFWGQVLTNVPGPQTAVSLVGPQEAGNIKSWEAAQAAALADTDNTSFTVEDTIYTDYTTQDAFNKVTDYLQANPDTTAIVSIFIDVSIGAVQAINELGMEDQVKVYENSGSEISVKLVNDGDLAATAPLMPKSNGMAAVQYLVDAYNGETLPRVVPFDGAPEQYEEFGWITKDNVNDWIPDF